MSMYHKIWIEVDVENEIEAGKKTQKLMDLMEVMGKVECVKNITKCQYVIPGDTEQYE